MYFLMFLIFSLAVFAQQDICINEFMASQQLLKSYKYVELEKKLEEAVKICPIDQYQSMHHQLALVYMWKGKFEKAKPIIDKITQEAEYKQTQVPSVQALGKPRLLNIIYFNYTNNTKEIEKEIGNFNNLNFKAQEALFFYFLRKNDKRFLQYYGIRKQIKGDMVPILCQVYCKKNNIIKDCPCTEKVERKIEGGIYALLMDYLNGVDLNTIKEKVEKYYKDVPEFKKDIYDILVIK